MRDGTVRGMVMKASPVTKPEEDLSGRSHGGLR